MSLKSVSVLSLVAILSLSLFACGDDDDGTESGDPSATPTAAPGTSGRGPEITFLGLIRADDRLIEPNDETSDGIPIYERPETIDGASGFSIVVEARPGLSGSRVGISSFDASLSDLPDLQIQVSRPLGDGSASVCDDPRENPGGVPATDPIRFDANDDTIAAMNDFGCHFQDGTGESFARTSSRDSCVTFESGDFSFVADGTTTQFCGAISAPLGFPLGDTLVTVRIRDEAGNVGPQAQLIVRVF